MSEDGRAAEAADERPDLRPPPTTPARSVRSRTHGRGRAILIGGGVVVLLALGAAAWLLYSGLQARRELEVARAGVRTLRADIAAGDLDAAKAAASDLRGHADRAHDLTTGPLWAAAAAVPGLGTALTTTRSVTTGVAALADDALPALVRATDTLDPSSLRADDGSFDVRAIEAVTPGLDHAVAVIGTVTNRIRASSGDTWAGSVNTARADLLRQLGDLGTSVQAADTAAAVLPTMLGADRPMRYMVTFQNEAELRGAGGLPGAFAIMRADRGRITFTSFQPDGTLNGVDSGLDLGKDYERLWAGDPTGLYLNSNISPHFPYAGRIWTAMWQRKSGQRLDGAVALDPTTLSYLLAVTGPARLADGTAVSASDVVDLTQRTVYRRFAASNEARKTFLLQLARAVSAELVSTDADPTALVKAAGRAAGEHRLLVWTSDAAVERRLEPYPVSGSVPLLRVPYAGLTLINSGGDKLDYYLHAALTWQRSGCGPTREVTVTIRLRNDAPAHGLPAYVLGYTGQRGFPKTAGVNRTIAFYYASASATLQSATHNGRPLRTGDGSERGHPVIDFGVDLPIGVTQSFVLHLREPGGPDAPTVRAQPMVHPMSTTVRDEACTS